MLLNLRELTGYAACATDGRIGTVSNFLLDDSYWTIRYLVTDPTDDLDSRRPILSPIALKVLDREAKAFLFALTLAKVKASPQLEVNCPLTRRQELLYSEYYGYPAYWGHTGAWGTGRYPGLLSVGSWNRVTKGNPTKGPGGHLDEVRLRGMEDLCGVEIIGGHQEAIGLVDDFIIDDETWEVRYLVIDLSLGGRKKHVLLAPHWADRIGWNERKAYVRMSKETIMNSPEWTFMLRVDGTFEARLHDYYGNDYYERPLLEAHSGLSVASGR